MLVVGISKDPAKAIYFCFVTDISKLFGVEYTKWYSFFNYLKCLYFLRTRSMWLSVEVAPSFDVSLNFSLLHTI